MMKLRYLIPINVVFVVLLHLNIWLHSMKGGYGDADEHANFVWTFALWTVLFGLVSFFGWVSRTS